MDVSAMNATAAAFEDLDWSARASRIAAAAAVLGGAGSLAGLFLGGEEFWWMLLVNFLFWGGIAQGMIIWAAILRAAQATWAAGVNRVARSAVHFLPVSLVLFALLFAGREHWLTWLHHPVPAKAKWLNEGFFFARNAAALLVLTGLSYWYVLAYRRLEPREGEEPSDHAAAVVNRLAIGLILAYVVVYTLLAFDLVMSLEPHWYSTLFGAYYFVGNQYAAMAAIIIVATLAGRAAGLEKHLDSHRFSDMGNLMMGFGILFSGFVFAQWLTIWYGNIPEEATYLHHRLYLFPWRAVGIAILVILMFGPFLLLQSRAAKSTPGRLVWIAAMVFAGLWLERWMLVVPALAPGRLAGLGPLCWSIPIFCAGSLALAIISSLRQGPRVSGLDLALKLE
jgi:hypothetical protein